MSLFRDPPHLPLVAPSILSADFMRMGDEARSALAAGGDLLHVDVMDGHFVPNLTMGPDMVKGLRRLLPDAFLDIHLMIEKPDQFAKPFIDAGASHLTFHAEVVTPEQARALADHIRDLGASVGLALNPPTLAKDWSGVLPHFDLILVMSIFPGFSGQKFMPEVLPKVSELRGMLRHDQRLEMDGGLTLETAPWCRAAGCDVLAAASAIFGAPTTKRADIIGLLRG